jgi:hypothetical protein
LASPRWQRHIFRRAERRASIPRSICGRSNYRGITLHTVTAWSTCYSAARRAASAVLRSGGIADLQHGGVEIMFALREAIQSGRIEGRAESLSSDRERLRASLSSLTTMPGLLGSITRTSDRESRKPFVIVRSTPKGWVAVEGHGVKLP